MKKRLQFGGRIKQALRPIVFVLASFGVLASCGHGKLAEKKPLVTYRQKKENEKPKNKNQATVRWEDGSCTVMRDRIIYVSEMQGRIIRGEKKFGMSLLLTEPGERFLDIIPGSEFTAILTNKSLVFTVGAKQVFSDDNPSLLKPVTNDFFIIPYDAEKTVENGFLGWTVTGTITEKEKYFSGFFLMKDGRITVRGAEKGKSRWDFQLKPLFRKKSILKFYNNDLFIAHPGFSYITIISNITSEPVVDYFDIGEPVLNEPLFESTDGLYLKNGKKRILIKKDTH